MEAEKTSHGVLTEKEISFFHKIDEKIDELYKKKHEAMEKIISERGNCSGFIKIEDAEKPYIRVTLKDLLPEITEGKLQYKNTAFSRYEVSISKLKNPPK